MHTPYIPQMKFHIVCILKHHMIIIYEFGMFVLYIIYINTKNYDNYSFLQRI